MEQMPEEFLSMLSWLLPLILILALWELVWKLIALWKAGRNNELGWFIAIALLNTVGILPITYILLRKNRKPE